MRLIITLLRHVTARKMEDIIYEKVRRHEINSGMRNKKEMIMQGEWEAGRYYGREDRAGLPAVHIIKYS